MGVSVKILAVSDQVEDLLYSPGIVDRFADIDLVISSGDLPMGYLDFIATMLCRPLYYVFGNHAPSLPYRAPLEASSPPPAGGVNLNGRSVCHNGLLIAGLEGSIRYNRSSRYQYTEREMREKVTRLVPRLLWNKVRTGRYLDIMVTHAPPRGIHDREDPAHRGFKSFLWLIDRFRPRYFIHGHTHRFTPFDGSRSFYKGTEVINAYGHVVVEIDVPPMPLQGCDADGEVVPIKADR